METERDRGASIGSRHFGCCRHGTARHGTSLQRPGGGHGDTTHTGGARCSGSRRAPGLVARALVPGVDLAAAAAPAHRVHVNNRRITWFLAVSLGLDRSRSLESSQRREGGRPEWSTAEVVSGELSSWRRPTTLYGEGEGRNVIYHRGQTFWCALPFGRRTGRPGGSTRWG